MFAIESKGLTRRYGSLVALDHLDLAVERGTLCALLGPNGAGKTTTIHLLTGLIRPSAGTALVDGVDVAREPLAAKARLGVVPQRSNLYGELSARDNLVFIAQLYGLPRRRWRPRADDLLHQFGLADCAARPFAQLSGGMKRRLTVAAALVHEPPILLLDEPTTGLDVESARHLRQTIASLAGSGVTVLLTTHLITEAEVLAQRVAVLAKGRLVALDTPAGLRARRQTEQWLEVDVPAATPALVAALREEEGLDASLQGDTVRLPATPLDAVLPRVCAAVARCGLHISAIRSTGPTLEDAIVDLTRSHSLESTSEASPQTDEASHRKDAERTDRTHAPSASQR